MRNEVTGSDVLGAIRRLRADQAERRRLEAKVRRGGVKHPVGATRSRHKPDKAKRKAQRKARKANR